MITLENFLTLGSPTLSRHNSQAVQERKIVEKRIPMQLAFWLLVLCAAQRRDATHRKRYVVCAPESSCDGWCRACCWSDTSRHPPCTRLPTAAPSISPLTHRLRCSRLLLSTHQPLQIDRSQRDLRVASRQSHQRLRRRAIPLQQKHHLNLFHNCLSYNGNKGNIPEQKIKFRDVPNSKTLCIC